jgi:DNA replicative helicase MCM subunit Mcm2 (Cdc46/Mcm family)
MKEPEFFNIFERVKQSNKHENRPYIEFDLDFRRLSELVKGSYKESALLMSLDRFIDSFETCSETFIPSMCLTLWHYIKEKEINGKKVFVSLYNFPVKEISRIQSHEVNYFVSVRVVVVRVSQVKLLAKSAIFTCQTCHGDNLVYLSNGVYKSPQTCKVRMTCRGKTFT